MFGFILSKTCWVWSLGVVVGGPLDYNVPEPFPYTVLFPVAIEISNHRSITVPPFNIHNVLCINFLIVNTAEMLPPLTSKQQSIIPFRRRCNPTTFFLIWRVCTSDLCPFFKFSNWRPSLKSMAVPQFLKSTSNDVTDVYPNPYQ